jgi:hypothetical protein
MGYPLGTLVQENTTAIPVPFAEQVVIVEQPSASADELRVWRRWVEEPQCT